ncbi:MAG: beta-phosphoglucomutase [Saprospiraceae bacterium]|nr:beta-phosphoglucomutase [Saprospiraceae bacterium]MBK8449306.1 beta-phosphoglucomutase [Saprospiraceae bacterium]MBK8484622.1 beta-phosphoglucomutase [Saprospiraceae bacterium]MBK9222050.1 beta-phosphoglucomutase [Saprospiraceae bacterium]
MTNKIPTSREFAFIFDLDGVLVDTSKNHFLAWKKLAQKFDFELTEKFNERLQGVSRLDSLDLILEAAHVEIEKHDKLKLATEKNIFYLESIAELNENDLLPGVLDFLKEAKRIEIPIALGSASKNANLILEKTGISPYFAAVVDGNMVTKSKPNPEVFLKAAELLNYDPKRCIVFEDSIKGVDAAVSAKMHVVGIGTRNKLNEADLVFRGFQYFKAYEIINWYTIM